MSRTAAQQNPSRARTGIVAPLAALAAGPAAWAAQLIGGYAASSLACYPYDAPVLRPPGPGEQAALIVLNLACLGIAVAGLATSALHWRRAKAPQPGASNDTLPAGLGRARFVAACGMLSGLGFVLAILFDTAPILGTPACWSLFR